MSKPDEVIRALRAVMLGAERYRHALAHHFGLGVTEAQALSFLTSKGELGQSQLAGMLGITTGATTSLIDRLTAADLAHRTSHPTDRRRAVITLSDQGIALVKEGHIIMDQLFEGLVAEDVDRLAAALTTLSENIERQAQRLSHKIAS